MQLNSSIDKTQIDYVEKSETYTFKRWHVDTQQVSLLCIKMPDIEGTCCCEPEKIKDAVWNETRNSNVYLNSTKNDNRK